MSMPCPSPFVAALTALTLAAAAMDKATARGVSAVT